MSVQPGGPVQLQQVPLDVAPLTEVSGRLEFRNAVQVEVLATRRSLWGLRREVLLRFTIAGSTSEHWLAEGSKWSGTVLLDVRP